MEKYYPINKFARIIGVTSQTLRNWENSGKLVPHHRSDSNYRYYSEEQLQQILGGLATTAEYRDQQDTAIHLRHISEYSSLIAQSMGLTQENIEIVRYASPLHDIGKVGIADAILLRRYLIWLMMSL